MLDRLLSLIAPHECVTCHAEGSVLCKACAAKQSAVPERCYKCLKLSPGCETCPKCRRQSPLRIVQVATPYTEEAKKIIWGLKFSHARAAVQPMAALLVERLVFEEGTILMPVPTATSRVRQRGYDQSVLLARAISRQIALPWSAALARRGQSRQVGTTRAARKQHLLHAFRIKGRHDIRGRHIVLVDDVVTTGATLEAAATVLKKAGAARVDAVVFAQA